jgi:hypothetical protein
MSDADNLIGLWESRRPEHLLLSGPPMLLDRALQFTTAYAFVRRDISQADAPVIVDADGRPAFS